MKKITIFIMFMTALLIINTRNVYASLSYGEGLKCQVSEDKMKHNCTLQIEITKEPFNINRFQLTFDFKNVTIDIGSIKPSSDWNLIGIPNVGSDKVVFTIENNEKAVLPVGVYVLGTFTLNTVEVAQECNYTLNVVPQTVNRTCEHYLDQYYGKNGGIVDYLTFQKECETHTCQVLSDGTRYGKNGTVVNQLNYQKECEKNVCTILSDGTRYGKDGKQVDQLTYQKECNKNVCKILSDGTRYGKDGKVVDPLNYQKECNKNVCTILSDGTRYGKDGTVVDTLAYQKECNKNVCAILSDGTIYGKNGTVVEQSVYDSECGDYKYCTVIKDKYYDASGNETDEMNYLKTCFTNTCKQIGDTFYDKEGKETTEYNYLASCFVNTCKQIGDVYYGPEGTVVDENTYMSICMNEVDNPKTGIIIPIFTLVGLGIAGLGILYYTKKHNRFI